MAIIRKKGYTDRAGESTDATDKISITPETVSDDFGQILDKIAAFNKTHIDTEHKNTASYINHLKETLKLTQEIGNTLETDRLLHAALEKIVSVFKAERGFITLFNDQNHLEIKTLHNMTREEIIDRQCFDYDYITALVLESSRGLISSDVARDERFSHLLSSGVFPQHSLLCVPLLSRGKANGTIFLENHHKSRIFIESDLHLLNLYGRIISSAVANAELYRTVVTHNDYQHSVLADAPVGLVVIAPGGQIATINQAALEIFDLNMTDVVTLEQDDRPTNFIDILPVTEKPRWSRIINTVLTTGQNYFNARYSHNTGYLEKVLSIKIFMTREFPYDNYGLVMFIDDVTEQILLEKYIIFSEKLVARGEMAARVAHKLNNFLTVIANNIELLKMNLERQKSDKAAFNANTVLDQVFKIKDFLETIVETPKVEPGYISFSLNRLINDVLFSLNNDLNFKTILFTLELADNLPNIEINVEQIQQVLLNLLHNAAEAVDEKALTCKETDYQRRIRIATSYNGALEKVTLAITDNGPGIKKKNLGKIFNLHFTTKKNHHGLGLYNSRMIIEQHRGRLMVDSSPGKGTTMTVILPRFQPKNIPENLPDL